MLIRRARPFRLSRRTLLRGGSYALALPWLEAMAPRRAAADTGPNRALFVYFPSGYTKGNWPAAGTTTDFTLPPLARALDPWKKKLAFISGLANAPATVFSEAGGLHARGTGCSLVCEPLAASGFAGAGVSVDQVIARALGKDSCLSSLVLGLPHERVPTAAEEGYSAVFYNNVSYVGPRSPVQKVSSPADLFLRLVTCPGFGAPRPARRARFEQAVMAAVKDKASRLMSCAGQADRVRLEEYFTSVSELERRFLPAAPAATCPRRSEPPAVTGTTLAESASAMMELAVLALQCGLTRVGTLMLDGAFSRRNFGLPELGGANYIHGLSHGEIGGEEADNPRWLKITALYFQLHAQLLSRLEAIDDGGATLLDRTIVTIGSEFGDGSRHDPSDLPFILAGGTNRLRTGQALAARPGTPVANAYVDVLQALGIDRRSFGDSTGTIPGLRL